MLEQSSLNPVVNLENALEQFFGSEWDLELNPLSDFYHASLTKNSTPFFYLPAFIFFGECRFTKFPTSGYSVSCYTEQSSMNALPMNLEPSQIRTHIRSKAAFLIDTQTWLAGRIHIDRWINNFGDHELELAYHLFNALLFFSNRATKTLFQTAIHNLCGEVVNVSSLRDWQTFFDSLYFCHVVGEEAHSTDSGHLFDRWVRDELGVAEARILTHSQVLNLLQYQVDGLHVVLVDDLVGSGHQMAGMWEHPIETNGGWTNLSEAREQSPQSRIFYCPLVLTQVGGNWLENSYPQLELKPMYRLESEYSAFDTHSRFWPDLKRAPAFIDQLRTVSMRAGIPEHAWRGYGDQGLSLAFDHGTPDLTLPIYHWQSQTWRSLV